MSSTPSSDQIQKPICVVFDTNIWISGRLLKSGTGKAMIFAIKQLEGYIGLLEVIKRETIINLKKDCIEAEKKLKINLELIEDIIGKKINKFTPINPLEFEKAVINRFDELKKMIIDVSFSKEHASSALDRVIEGTPPNGPKNQQFKDSAIWEAILELAKSYNVHFITSDGNFFKDRNVNLGLAPNLENECKELGVNIPIYESLEMGLKYIGVTAPSFDYVKPLEEIDKIIKEELGKNAESKNFIVGEKQKHGINHYLTEKPDVLGLTFRIQYNLVEAKEIERIERLRPEATVIGECSYNRDENTVYDIRVDTIEYKWFDVEGKEVCSRSIFVRVGSLMAIGQVPSVM